MAVRTAEGGRGAVAMAAGLVAVGATAAETASALSVSLFAALGPRGVASFRFVIAAALLLVIVRPRRVAREPGEWGHILAYGAAMAGTALCLHAAIDRIPLGIAVTLQFLGPCAVAMVKARRVAEGAVALVALGGVALIARPGGDLDGAGVGFALGAAVFLGLYTLGAERVGKSGQPLENLALAVTAAALVSAPFARDGLAHLDAPGFALLAATAVLGVVVPYTADTFAASASSARVIGTLFALDPVIGLGAGWLILDQRVGWVELAGVGLVAVAGASLVWTPGAGRGRAVGSAP
jgi:inner membrane transporter RhtA